MDNTHKKQNNTLLQILKSAFIINDIQYQKHFLKKGGKCVLALKFNMEREDKEEKPREYRYTGNVINKNRKTRNVIEMIIEIILFFLIINKIRFTSIASLFFSITFIPAIAFVNIKGINGLSLTTALKCEMNYRKNCRKLHLWSPEYCRKEKELNELSEKSKPQLIVEKFKKSINRFVETYSTDTDSKRN